MYFDFYDLIGKYSMPFTLVEEGKGYYDDKGNYVKGEAVKTELTGAVMNIRDSKLYRSEGTLTSADKELYCFDKIENIVNAYVIWKDNKYKVEATEENAEFTGVYRYTLKYVSAFNENPQSAYEESDSSLRREP